MNILIGYDRCSTCKKAEDFLKAEGVSFQKRPIKEEKLSAKEIHEIRERSGLPLKRFFNTSGLVYKAMETPVYDRRGAGGTSCDRRYACEKTDLFVWRESSCGF